MEKVRPWCGQPWIEDGLRTEQNKHTRTKVSLY